MRSHLFYIGFMGIFTSLNASALLKEGAPLYLELGEQRLVTFPDIERYSVSGDSVHYVRIENEKGILVKAMKPGIATLYLSTTSHQTEVHLIRVEQKKAHPYPPALLQALNQVHETEVIDGGDHFILRGEVKNQKEAQALAYLKENFAPQITDETRIEKTWFIQSKNELTHLLADHPGLSIETRDDALAIQGGVPNAAIKESIVKKIKSIQALTQIEIQTVKDSDPTLYFKIFLLEVKREAISSLGVEWPSTTPSTINLSPTQFLISNSLDLTIHALSERGLARILSSPELVVKAPGQAELFAGGELPIRERSKFTDSVTWKNVGLSLKIDVKEYGGEKVRLVIETEISHLDNSLMNDNIPGIQTNRIKTLVDGTFGKPLLLSGLLQEDMHETSKGLPGLSLIPVLGKLFSSEDYQNNRSELVAILLPRRELPTNPQNRISSAIPKGYLPLPRSEVTDDEKEAAKSDRHYPWNSL